MKVVTMGAHILDVLVHPVESIPPGQATALVQQVRLTAAGTAAGTALSLAKLGATVSTAGAVGTDATGDLLVSLLERAGIDTTMVVRIASTPSSVSILPIRPNGERPSLHLLGANTAFTPADVVWDKVASADHLHLGAPELLGPDNAGEILRRAKELGLTTSVDLIAPGNMGAIELIAPALAHTDYLLPNLEQVLGFTGIDEPAAACRRLIELGAGLVAATMGGDGVLVAQAERIAHVPAFATEVVDTTGCGDAFSAGFLVGVAAAREPLQAAVLGCATAALVAGGLGSDHGEFDLVTADEFAAATPALSTSYLPPC
ncbi:carbohydrate kinase family protein [Nocardia barduliensis]|uniref:carbohydrate kinase family protein n=1 Tax=Nocardia barduliensis TaxID=2736643 RepID=UPI00157367F8|nr:PfkB family carbohydrate kinase [Nocardia barduliensis]